MRSKGRLRRSPRLAVLLALGVLVVVGVAVAGRSGPVDLTYVPRSADEIQNIDVVRTWISNYYGDPTRTGVFSNDSSYAKEAASVAADGSRWLRDQRSKHRKRAIVLDVDDTTLATWNYEIFSKWIYNPATNGTYVLNEWFPPVPGMVDMVNKAQSDGFAVFFITGRPNVQWAATLANLTTGDWDGVVTSPPSIDAGYPTPTTIDTDGTGPGVPGPGLFTKPPVGSYPDFLNKPEFCADAIAAAKSCPTIQYKSGVRAYIQSQGYEIVGNFGDQYSDLEGGYSKKTFKLPNPNYYLP